MECAMTSSPKLREMEKTGSNYSQIPIGTRLSKLLVSQPMLCQVAIPPQSEEFFFKISDDQGIIFQTGKG